MAIAVLQNVGTILRHANAALQEIPSVAGEEPPIEKVQGLANDLVATLDKLGVGASPVPEDADVVPTATFMQMSQLVMTESIVRLAPLTQNDLPVQLSDIQDLRDRIVDLNAGLAVAIIRKP